MILYIQANLGISAADASGNLGPTTQAGLPTIPSGLPSDTTKSRHFVRAVVFALLANGYNVSINRYWSSETSNAISKFQKDMALPMTGVVDFTTWMSLLVSYGDKNRSYSACDTRFEITNSRLTKLKSMGIEAVGRYINGTSFKVLRKVEFKRLIDAGIGLIPIYQQNALSSDDFSYEIGEEQGTYAQEFARGFGIPKGSIIYFAVDYDAQDSEITNYIIPYFKGVKKSCSDYKIGVYGTRNVCSRVSDAGLSVSSYVSNMSSGYSGNLGFKMPDNWNFDQFDEIRIDDWDLDRVVYSGRQNYVTEYIGSVVQEPNPDGEEVSIVIDRIIELEELAQIFRSGVASSTLVLDYLRHLRYLGNFWSITLGMVHNSEFVEYVKNSNESLHNYFVKLTNSTPVYVKDLSGGSVDLAHFAVTLLKYTSTSIIVPAFWSGWGGDLATLTEDFVNIRTENVSYQGLADRMIGNGDYTFDYYDICSDFDAIVLSKILGNSVDGWGNINHKSVSSSLTEYYITNRSNGRYTGFISSIELDNTASEEEISNKIFDRMTNIKEFGLHSLLAPSTSVDDFKYTSLALARYVKTRL